jgi:hypothetical protein
MLQGVSPFYGRVRFMLFWGYGAMCVGSDISGEPAVSVLSIGQG